MELEPADANCAGNLIFSLRESGKSEEAVVFGKKWEKEHKPNAVFWNMLGFALYNLKQFEESTICFKKACKLEPANAEFAKNLIVLFRVSGKLDESIKFGNEWKKEHKPNASFWNQLGNAFYCSKQFEEAIDCYKEAYELTPGDITIAKNLFNSFREANKDEEAANFGKEWAEKYQADENFVYSLISCIEKLNRFDEVIEYKKKYLEFKPEDAYRADNVISCLHKYGKSTEAIDFGLQWLEKNQPNSSTLNQIGVIYRDLHLFDKAIEYFNKALEVSPSAYIALNIIDSLCKTRRANEAFEFAIQWGERNKTDSSFWNNAGIQFSNIFQSEKSVVCFKKATELEPKNATLAGNFISALNAVDKYEEAVRFGESWKQNYQPNDHFNQQLAIAYAAYNKLQAKNKPKEEPAAPVEAPAEPPPTEPHQAEPPPTEKSDIVSRFFSFFKKK